MNNKNISVWRGDNTPPTQYHLWLKNDGKLYVNIDKQWQEIDKDSVAQITEVLNQHATKLDNHQTALDYINTLHSKLWTPGKGNFSVMTQGVNSGADSTTGAIGDFSLAEGLHTTAKGSCSHAEGFFTRATGGHSHAEGSHTIASIDNAHAQGQYNIDNALYLHCIGIGTEAQRKNSEYLYFNPYVESDAKNGYKYLIGIGGYDGVNDDTTTYKSIQEVINTLDENMVWLKGVGNNAVITAGCKESINTDESKGAIGDLSVAEGEKTTAKKTAAHAEGCLTVAGGFHSHAEGYNTKALGDDAHAEGSQTEARGVCAHAEGSNTKATDPNSHAEGLNTRAVGGASHAEGQYSLASGYIAHAEGANTIASGYCAHAQGDQTIASGWAAHAQGIYNIDNRNAIHSVGIGDSMTRKNAEYIYAKSDETGYMLVDDPKNGYKYLIGVGGYDGISTNNTTYKSVQEVIADLTARIEQLETKVKALEDANTPA